MHSLQVQTHHLEQCVLAALVAHGGLGDVQQLLCKGISVQRLPSVHHIPQHGYIRHTDPLGVHK